jgi:tetratricopeptide (TPR) repeat protein
MNDKEISSRSGGISYGDGATDNVSITGGVRDVYINKPASGSLPPPRQLRKPLDDFTGREKEVYQLIEALSHGGRASISGISGMGGIGKTELALLVADRLIEEYPDAQLFIEMHGTDKQPLSASEALSRCIRAFLGLEARLPNDIDELTTLYRSCLSGKRALVLLDNASDRNQVLPLVPPTGCALLVTSRAGISMPGMERLVLDQLNPEEARSLLRGIAPRITPEVADRIGHLCGYLPLAIRAAGSLLDVTIDLDPAEYAEQLFDERTRLERIGAEGVDIGVETSLNLSYAHLEPEAALVFSRLSVFVESFDAAAEEFVCDDPGHKYLSELVRRSLVSYQEKNRYRLHDLARVFARARSSETELEAGRRQHAAHYRGVLSVADALFLEKEGGVTRGLALFDAERVNIEAGWEWARALAETDEAAAKLCIEYPNEGSYVLNLRQHPRERIEWFEAMLSAARWLKMPNAEGAALDNLGSAYKNLGEVHKAIEYSEQALAISREIGDRRGKGTTLSNLGLAYADLGEARKAIEYYEQHLEIAREIGDRRSEGNALGGIGSAYGDLGEAHKAIEYAEQALAISREIGDRRSEGISLGNLGIDYGNLGEAHKAIEYHEQHLEIAREIGDRRGEGNALGNLGTAYGNLAEASKAIEHYEQALPIYREMGDRRIEAMLLYNKAMALNTLGDRAQAIPLLESALEIFEQIEDPTADQARQTLKEWREG